MTNIDLTANPATLRLHWRGVVKVKCNQIGQHPLFMDTSIPGSISINCPTCGGTGERDAAVEVDVTVTLILGYDDDGEPITSILIPGTPHVCCDDEKQAIEIILTRFQNGEEVDGVREII